MSGSIVTGVLAIGIGIVFFIGEDCPQIYKRGK